MSTTVSYRGYDGSVIHDAEDHLYHGKILGIRDFVIYDGKSPAETEKVFREAVDEYLGSLQKEGKEAPTPFASLPANVPHELRLKAALFAHEHHVDIESVVNMALANFLEPAA